MPSAGVPASKPVAGVNITPVGRVPVSESNGAGVPLAVTANVPGAVTVKLMLPALVMIGAVGVDTGVTIAVPEGGPMPITLMALTKQVYGVSLTRPMTVTGDTALLLVTPSGLQALGESLLATSAAIAEASSAARDA